MSRNYHRFRKILLYQDAEGPAQDYVLDPARVDALAAPDVPDAVIRVVALVLDRVPWIARRHVVAVPVIVQDVPVLAVLYVQDVPVALDVAPRAARVVVVALEDAQVRAVAVALDVPDARDRAVPVAVALVEETVAVQDAPVAVALAEEMPVVPGAHQLVKGNASDVPVARTPAQEAAQQIAM